KVHFVPRLHVESLVPGIDIPNDAVDAILGRAVLIGQELGSHRPLALLRLPAVAVGDKEALVARQALDHGRLAMISDIFAVGGIGDFESAEVAQILAQCQLPLDVDTGDRLVAVVLRDELIRMRRVELGGIRAPPIGEAPALVEFTALVVKAMPDLMSDRRAYAAVI